MVRKIKKNKKKSDVTLKKTRLEFQMFSAEVLESEIILDECIDDFNDRFETGRDKKIVEESEAQEIAKSERSFEKEQERIEKEKEKNREEHKDVLPEDKDLRKLFKKIALKTHPDKLLNMDEDEA